jgi:3',5'-cyclic AMP phosphodiesterase CpdA
VRTIVHVSDLHFGAIDPETAAAAREDVAAARPSVVVVSGDLTQRARSCEFRAARDWLDALPGPRVVVPGNHDIPLFDLARRFLSPLRRYRRYISDDLVPEFVDDELAVLGVNTARSLTWKEGRISVEEIDRVQQRLCALPGHLFKVLVTHHPFVPPPDDPRSAIVGRAARALRRLESCGVALLLAGHLHVGWTGDVAGCHLRIRRHILVAQAGTLSRRIRDQPNGYNQITIDPPRLVVATRSWNGGGFTTTARARFVERDGRWREDPPDEPPDEAG